MARRRSNPYRFRSLALEHLEGREVPAGIQNPGFESGTFPPGWTTVVPNQGSAAVVTTYTSPAGDPTPNTFLPQSGKYYALLESPHREEYTTVSQTFTVSAGQKISGYTFFDGNNTKSTNDSGEVRILNGSATLATVFQADIKSVGDYGSTPWTKWEYKFTSGGTFTIEARIKNAKSSSRASHLGLDSVMLGQPPTANNQSVPATGGAPLLEDSSGRAITLTASDPDGDPLTYRVVTGPTKGTLSGTAPNLTYTPAANFYGSDSFTFVANDGSADSNVATVSITVSPVNDAPTLGAFNATPHVLKTRSVSVPVPASDIDSTALTYSLTGAPAWVTLGTPTNTPTADMYGNPGVNTSATLTVNPGIDILAGDYPFTVTVTDNGSGTGPNRDSVAKSVTQNITVRVYAAGVVGNDLYIYGSSGKDDISATSSPAISPATTVKIGSLPSPPAPAPVQVPIVTGTAADSPEATSFIVPAGGKIVVVAGGGDDQVTLTGAVPANVQGGAGIDSLAVIGTPNDDNISLTNSGITVNGAAIPFSADVESYSIDGAAGMDTIAVGPLSLAGDLSVTSEKISLIGAVTTTGKQTYAGVTTFAATTAVTAGGPVKIESPGSMTVLGSVESTGGSVVIKTTAGDLTVGKPTPTTETTLVRSAAGQNLTLQAAGKLTVYGSTKVEAGGTASLLGTVVDTDLTNSLKAAAFEFNAQAGSTSTVTLASAAFTTATFNVGTLNLKLNGADFGALTVNAAAGGVVDIDLSGADFTTLTIGQGDTVGIDLNGADFTTLVNNSPGAAIDIDIAGANFGTLLNTGDDAHITIDLGGADFGSLTALQNGGDGVTIDITGADFTTLVNTGDGTDINIAGADFGTLVNVSPEQYQELLLNGGDFSTLVSDPGATATIDITGADFGTLVSTGQGSVIDINGADFTTLVNIGDGATIDIGGADFTTLVNSGDNTHITIDTTGADFGTLVNSGDGANIDITGAEFGTPDQAAADFTTLVNSGANADIDISGADFGTLVNTGDNGSVTIMANGADFSTFTSLQNSGDAVSIDVTGADFGSLSNSGDAVSIDISGAHFDVVTNTGNGLTHVAIVGGVEANTVVLGGNGLSGVTLDGGDGDDVFVLQATNSTVAATGGLGNDKFVVGSTAGLTATLTGGVGNDRYTFAGPGGAAVTVNEPTAADFDTLDFSAFTGSAVSIDLASTAAQAVGLGLSLTLSDGLAIENVIGTALADVIRGNGRDNALAGADLLDDRVPSAGAAWNGRVQHVVLDFTTFTNADPNVPVPAAGAKDNNPNEHVYTAAEQTAIRDGLAAEYASLGGAVVFHIGTTDPLPAEYTTIYFNRSRFVPGQDADGNPIQVPQPGGEASEVDFRNTHLTGWATAQVNGLLGGAGQPAATSANFVAASVWMAAHEFGHTLGLRHSDSFGPIGYGVNSPPGTDKFTTADGSPYPGPAAAYETNRHIMASPAATGFTLADLVSDTYFGERELVKLAYTRAVPSVAASTGLLIAEAGGSAVNQPITLVPLDVPNTMPAGLNGGKKLAAAATTVLGTIAVGGQKDTYTFAGRAGDLLNVEVFSRGILANRYADTADTVVRVLFNGQVIASNDDQFELDTSLVDLVLPADGTYTIEVSAFSAADTGSYELFAYRFDTANAADAGDYLEGRGGNDLLEGGIGDDTYVFSGTNLGTDTVREDVRLEAQGLPDSGRDLHDLLDFTTYTGAVALDLAVTAPQAVSANLTLKLSSALGVEDVRMSAAGGSVFGNARGNTLADADGNDTFDGRDGDDVFVLSGNGNDNAAGGNGNDTFKLFAMRGTDTVSGGAGTDTVDLTARVFGASLNLGTTGGPQGVDSLYSVVLTGPDIENAIGSVASGNQLTGNSLDNVLVGGSVADTLVGGAGNDTLTGGAGDDSLDGGNGDDLLDGGAGYRDVLLGGEGTDTLTDADGVVRADGGNGTGQITLTFAPGWNDNGSKVLGAGAIAGGNGNDTIVVTVNNAGVQLDIAAGNGTDRIELYGTWGTIAVHGGNGTDTLKRPLVLGSKVILDDGIENFEYY